VQSVKGVPELEVFRQAGPDLVLAQEPNPGDLLLDDSCAVRIASGMSLNVVGTPGVFRLAKQRDLILTVAANRCSSQSGILVARRSLSDHSAEHRQRRDLDAITPLFLRKVECLISSVHERLDSNQVCSVDGSHSEAASDV